jgi:glutamate-1-semialdehyde 2,1-aminomutase
MRLASAAGIPVTVNHIGSMFTLFFTQGPVRTPGDAMKADAKRYGLFFQALLEEGVYFPPSQYEAAFVSTQHTDEICKKTLAAAEKAFAKLRKRR